MKKTAAPVTKAPASKVVKKEVKAAPAPVAKKMPAKKMMAEKKEVPDRTGRTMALGVPRAGVRAGSKGRAPSAPKNLELEKHLKMIKSPVSELRKVDEEEDAAVLELGLVIDVTGSMQSWIDRAKQTLIEIIDKVVADCAAEGKLSVRISISAYRDHKDRNRYEIFPFNSDVEAAKAFIGKLNADGGADTPEDVTGGLKLMLMQDWTVDGNKKCFMIADAPCHGKKYHNCDDSYPTGCPNGLVLEDLMNEFREKDIDFNLIKLASCMDKMAEIMHKTYGLEEEGFEMKDMAPQKIVTETGIERIETADEVTHKFTKHAVESTTKCVVGKMKKKGKW